MKESRAVLFLSYYGPEEAASGIRAGRLARAAALAGERVLFLYGSKEGGRERWVHGVELVSFQRRSVPSLIRPPVEAVRGTGRRGWIKRAVATTARAFVQPDWFVLSGGAFAQSAIVSIERLANSGHSAVLVASAPPWSTALLAARVARRTNTPLVADLQDLWASNPVAHWPPFGQRRAARWERQLLAAANGFLFVNEEIQRRFEDRSPLARTKPSAIAPIGLEQSIQQRLHVAAQMPLRIGYFGSIYGDRSFEVLLKGIASLGGSVPKPTLHWYGELMGDHHISACLHHYVSGGTLVLHPSLPYQAAREAMRSYDLLLVIPSPRYPEELTTKFYDYVDAGRPVLALASPNSLLHALVTRSQVGVVASPSDVTAVRGLLERVIRSGLTLIPQPDALESHRLPALTASIVKVLDAIRPIAE